MFRNPIDVVTVSKIQKIIEPYINTIISKQNHVSDWEDYVSKEYLLDCIGRDIPKNECNNFFRLYSYTSIHDQLINVVKNFYPGYEVKSSGDFHYPKTGYMGWHTNHDNPLERVYITYATEERKSFFRYIENGKMITDYDNKGITVRQFKVTDKPPYFWHCVGSECDRLSFGYTLNKNKNDG